MDLFVKNINNQIQDFFSKFVITTIHGRSEHLYNLFLLINTILVLKSIKIYRLITLIENWQNTFH